MAISCFLLFLHFFFCSCIINMYPFMSFLKDLTLKLGDTTAYYSQHDDHIICNSYMEVMILNKIVTEISQNIFYLHIHVWLWMLHLVLLCYNFDSFFQIFFFCLLFQKSPDFRQINMSIHRS